MHQPYDNSIKAILKEDAADIVPQLLPGAIFVDVLDIEVLRSALRVDRVYQIYYRDRPHILHLEFQADGDEEMAQRLLFYHAGLWRDYKQPVISMVIYLFKAPTPTSPLQELSGNKEIITFHYHILELWTLDARAYVQQHRLSMYTLLPAMDHADAPVLLQALEELVEYYKDSEAKLARRLLWFGTFLKRADTVTPLDKQKVRQRLDIFDKLLEENDFVLKQRALGEEQGLSKGREQGKIDGEVEASQQILLDILQTRYPTLAEHIQARVLRTRQVEKLREAIKFVVNTADEQKAHLVLDSILT
ncbi:MAG TPA: hypothetical protein VL485_29245 [Ktedonobacteraceae bacterium]|jgi:hypothetical protein|nr:hypothetical protein [Ktedonobacteraceae bacterium]